MYKTIYVASPYSSGFSSDIPKEDYPFYMDQRARNIAYTMSVLINNNTSVFHYSPICHFRAIALAGDLPHDRHFWWEVNKHMIERSDEMWIVDIHGWDKSDGVIQEIKYCLLDCNNPVWLINEYTGSKIRRIVHTYID